MTKPNPESQVPERNKRDERPSIIVRNQTMSLHAGGGRWERADDSGKIWTAKDNNGFEAKNLHVRVLQGNAGCQQPRQGSKVTVAFGQQGQHSFEMTLVGTPPDRNPRVMSSLPLNHVNPDRLTAAHRIHSVTVEGHSSCEFPAAGPVEIEICLKGHC